MQFLEMIEFNKTNEFNSIETGNTVYVSGLYGKNTSYINNKHGIVKNIYLTCDKGRITYSAEIEFLFDASTTCFINFDYIFKVGKLNNADIKSLIWEENPINYYILKKNLVECYPMHDENGQLLAVCNDFEGRKHIFLYSGIN
jgi:hypothetical protein